MDVCLKDGSAYPAFIEKVLGKDMITSFYNKIVFAGEASQLEMGRLPRIYRQAAAKPAGRHKRLVKGRNRQQRMDNAAGWHRDLDHIPGIPAAGAILLAG